MRFLVLVLAAIGLTACAVPAKSVIGPDGKQAYVLTCSGYMRDRQDCLVKAGQVCPSGYNVVDDSSQTSGAMVIGNTVAVARRDYLTISCK